MSVDSVFTRIIRGELPAHRVYETPHVLAFLDINPLAVGHTLVVPRRQVERLEQLEPDEAAELGRALVEVARRMLAATGAAGYNVLQNNDRIAGQEVPHVHFHLIPRSMGDGLGYRWVPKRATPESLAELAARMSVAAQR